MVQALYNKVVMVALVVAVSISSLITWRVQEWRHNAITAKAIEKAVRQAEKQARDDIKLALKHEKKLTKAEEKGREIEGKVNSSNCFDNVDVRLLNQASK